LIHVWHADQGFRAAKIRNDAIRRAAGDYVILLDGDCIPNRHFVRDHLALARRGRFFQGKRVLVEESIVGRFDCSHVNSKGALFAYFIGGGLGNPHHVLRCPWLPAFSAPGISGTRSCNMGLFKEDLLAVNGFNEDFVGWGREDSELAVRLTNLGLQRRTHPFMAICYHLWHAENDRTFLQANDVKLKNTMDSGVVYCRNGIHKTSDRH
ncbi:MAG TPA: galactosyltransferase-related protein, partial [Desulfosarcina sp.]|nr:galactosyltransferase-related protein [Desulfosarcina sp.]